MMSFNLNDLTEEQQYDLLRDVINAAATSPDYGRPRVESSQLIRDEGYPFDDEPGHVNLLGVRGFVDGKPKTDEVTAYDDRLFVLYKDDDGTKHVERFVFGTDTRYFEDAPDKASAYLVVGQHPYKLGCHGKSRHRIKLDEVTVVYNDDGTVDEAASRVASTDTSHWGTRRTTLGPVEEDFNSFGVGYRALIPYGFGTGDTSMLAVILRDTSHDREHDAGEEHQTNVTINIHHACYAAGPASKGCQTIPGWENYKRFIQLVEQDYSVKVAESGEGTHTTDPNPVRELADPPSGGETGTRPVIYTLVPGTFIEEVAQSRSPLAFPIDLGEGREVNATTIAQYFKATEQTFGGGYFPIGANTVWHGGVHLHAVPGVPVHACMTGRIVAARLPDDLDVAIQDYGSRNFILIEHEWEDRRFFSLYMHLFPLGLEADDLAFFNVTWLNEEQRVVYQVTEEGVRPRNVAGINDVKAEDEQKGPAWLDPLPVGADVELIEEEPDAAGDIWLKVRLPEGGEGYLYKQWVARGKLEETVHAEPSEERLEELRSGNVVKLDIPVKGGELLWLSGEYGSEGSRTGLLHWEIFSEDNLFPSDTNASNGEAVNASKPVGDLPESPAYATSASGPATARHGEVLTYEAGLNKSNPTEAEKNNISWKVWRMEPERTPPSGLGNGELRAWWEDQSHTTHEHIGVTLKVATTEADAGKVIIARPYRSYIEPGEIEMRTAVSTLGLIEWKDTEDSDDNYNMDSASVLALFDEAQNDGWFDSEEVLEVDELKRFYADEEKARTLRRYACKFVSEWGIPDLDNAAESLKGRWSTWGLADRIRPYLWWEEAQAAGVDLPSPHVWHYNPITVMEAFLSQGGPPVQAGGGGGSPQPAAVTDDMYGCHVLQRGDRDADPGSGTGPRWGGVDDAPAAVDGCTAASDQPQHVRQLQEDLRTLGFLLVGTPSGDFGRRTEWAVREFQIYAKMAHVARVRADAPQAAQQGAHLAAQEGQQGTLSAYVDGLEQVANDARYTGPVSGVVNADTRQAIKHWLDNNWRCPVIVEAWTIQGGNRNNLFQHNGNWAVNLWLHDDVPSNAPRMFVRDFTGYYTLPAGRNPDDMIVAGDFATYLSWSGPRSVPPSHTWAEGEILPDRLVGAQNLNAAQESTFKVVRSVAEVECIGFFDSVNSYDNAFVSVGPCHWTLGIITAQGVFSEGELCGYLAYLRHADRAAFEQAIEFFGVRVDENWVSAAGPADGADLFRSGSRKYAGWVALQQDDGSYQRLAETEDDGDYFKTWHWFYRFVMAGRTVQGYRRRMWHMARIRLRDIRNVPWGTGVANVADGTPAGRASMIGDVFTSERAMAIILRWHIRFPGHMVGGGNAGGRLRNAFAHASATPVAGGWGGDPSAWTDDHEAALVQGLQDEAQALGNQGLINSITYVSNWPNWHGGNNPRGYTLAAPVTNLSEGRDSFDFDATGLPPAPP